jgi:hypothetical protein
MRVASQPSMARRDNPARPAKGNYHDMTPYEWLFGLIVAAFIVATVLIITGVCALGIAFVIHIVTAKQ